jgi:hypothetical protein
MASKKDRRIKDLERALGLVLPLAHTFLIQEAKREDESIYAFSEGTLQAANSVKLAQETLRNK